MILDEKKCPNYENHTPDPSGYLQWHAWAYHMDEIGYSQIVCSDCGLWAIWVLKGKLKDMNAKDYQELASRTLIDGPDFEISNREIMIIWNAVGLAGEAGELSEIVKKGIFHQHGIDVEKVKKELGDVLWYVAALATKFELDLSEIMQANIDKLMIRYPSGFSSADSKTRVDVAS